MIHYPIENKYVQIGVVAGGLPDYCGNSNKPSVFTLLNYPKNFNFLLAIAKKYGKSYFYYMRSYL